MPEGISKAKSRRASKSLRSGKSRATAKMTAKAGRRKPPAAKLGAHLTTPEERQRGMFLSKFGLKPFPHISINRKGSKESLGSDQDY